MYHTGSTFILDCSWVEIHAAEIQAAAAEIKMLFTNVTLEQFCCFAKLHLFKKCSCFAQTCGARANVHS